MVYVIQLGEKESFQFIPHYQLLCPLCLVVKENGVQNALIKQQLTALRLLRAPLIYFSEIETMWYSELIEALPYEVEINLLLWDYLSILMAS